MPIIKKPNQHFDVKTYSGTGASQTVTVDFEPDFAWLKRRDGVGNNIIMDKLRLTSSLPNRLFSDVTNAESTTADGQNSFSSTGIVLDGTGGGGGDVNTSGRTYVAWQWKAGGAAVTNTSGTISSQVSANPTAGFSVVTYTGTGANATVGHGLGVAPAFGLVKSRSSVTDWKVWHQSLTSAAYYLFLNTTNAEGSASSIWGTSPGRTSTTFSVGTNNDTNASGSTYVAYCFAPVAGYSAFGSYTGNGSADGPFVYLGFRPRYVMVKRTDTTNNWFEVDSSRDTYNVMGNYILANSADAEAGAGTIIDFLSNGFKWRALSAGVNASGGTYIYMAFAEAPFKYSNGR